ncbi:MAG TPA: hypothetical protein ENN23_00630 [Deltaproteobacteria bacterium]|nr:hypothetical protein [Deltaproteobacteria bacterium]
MEEKSRRNFLRMMFTAFLAPLILKACNWSFGSGKEKSSNEEQKMRLRHKINPKNNRSFINRITLSFIDVAF